MVDPSRTTTVLLEGLRHPSDAQAWETFDNRYRPIVIGFAVRMGLPDADAADVAQETMAQFVQEFRAGRYDRTRGRLRTWLIAMARSKIAMLRRQRARRGDWRGDSALIDLANSRGLIEIWETQRREHILRTALGELRESTRLEERTIHAFELLVVRDMPAAAVARQLGVTTHDVYQAKSRVAQRLREILTSLESCFDDGAVIAGAGEKP